MDIGRAVLAVAENGGGASAKVRKKMSNSQYPFSLNETEEQFLQKLGKISDEYFRVQDNKETEAEERFFSGEDEVLWPGHRIHTIWVQELKCRPRGEDVGQDRYISRVPEITREFLSNFLGGQALARKLEPITDKAFDAEMSKNWVEAVRCWEQIIEAWIAFDLKPVNLYNWFQPDYDFNRLTISLVRLKRLHEAKKWLDYYFDSGLCDEFRWGPDVKAMAKRLEKVKGRILRES